MDRVNESTRVRDACADNCRGCADQGRLGVIAEGLTARGLEIAFDTCDSHTIDGHFDSVIVTNPREPSGAPFTWTPTGGSVELPSA